MQDDLASRLAAIVESSDDAIIGKTTDGVITSWNAGAERLFGYRAQEAIGQPVSMVVPDDRLDEEPAILARIARGERIHHFETVRRRKDGSLVDVSVTISPVRDAAGRIVGASKIARDITERRQAEARVAAQLSRLHLLDQVTRAIAEHQDLHSIYQVAVRSIEERMPADFACVCTLDDARQHLLVTRVGVKSAGLAMELALGHEGHVEVDANGLSQCLQGRQVYEPDTAALGAPFPARLAAAGLQSVVMSPLQSDAEVFGVLLAARAQRDGFGAVDRDFLAQLSANVSLATRQAELRASLQRAYDDLRQHQQAVVQHERLRALGQMASGVAHDINNAVSPALMHVESLLERETALSSQAREQLESAARAMGDVAAIVERLRDFYRPREMQRPMSPMSLNELVRQVVSLSRPRWSELARRRGVSVEVATELDDGLPAVVGHESEIREALVNLVFNAIDAMPDGGALRIDTRRHRPAGSAMPAPGAQVSVSDTGTGMDEATRRRCLDPFFTTKGDQGTGMGLSMVSGTAQRHGAELDIQSTPGRGTTVTLRFPPPLVQAAAPPPAEAPVRRTVGPLRVLVVDDDPLVLETLVAMLKATGHAVSAADGGQAGLAAFADALAAGQPFSVVMTDLGMPNVDGRAVAAEVKRMAPATPVLLLTGWGQGTQLADAQHVDRVMSKPPRLKELREVLNGFAQRQPAGAGGSA